MLICIPLLCLFSYFPLCFRPSWAMIREPNGMSGIKPQLAMCTARAYCLLYCHSGPWIYIASEFAFSHISSSFMSFSAFSLNSLVYHSGLFKAAFIITYYKLLLNTWYKNVLWKPETYIVQLMGGMPCTQLNWVLYLIPQILPQALLPGVITKHSQVWPVKKHFFSCRTPQD